MEGAAIEERDLVGLTLLLDVDDASLVLETTAINAQAWVSMGLMGFRLFCTLYLSASLSLSPPDALCPALFLYIYLSFSHSLSLSLSVNTQDCVRKSTHSLKAKST